MISGFIQMHAPLKIKLVGNLRQKVKDVGKDNRRRIRRLVKAICLLQEAIKQKLEIGATYLFNELEKLVNEFFTFGDGADLIVLEEGGRLCKGIDKTMDDCLHEIGKE